MDNSWNATFLKPTAKTDAPGVFPTLRHELFEAGEREGYSDIKVDAAKIKPAILAHAEFAAFVEAVGLLFGKWKARNTPKLKAIAIGDKPKALAVELGESLLAEFSDGSDRSGGLVDAYDVYQHFMTYWSDVMQDDVYMIAADGWQANSDLIPRELIINRYFALEQLALEELDAAREALVREMEEMDEEHGGEDGLLYEAKNEKGKLTKAGVKARVAEIKHDADSEDERKALNDYLALIEKESEAGKKVKDARKELDAKVEAKYRALTEQDVITLVVDDKWLAKLDSDVQTELDRVSQALTGRVKQLAERYAVPLPKLTEEVEALSARVDEHLEKMGFVWK